MLVKNKIRILTHHTKDKGDIGVIAVKFDLIKKGYLILNPETEHSSFDLVAYKNSNFYRLQVKYRKSKGDKIEVSSKTSWNDKKGTHIKKYDKSQIDYFAVYCPDNGKCYYIDSKSFVNSITLRLNNKTKNNQTKNINFAKDYELIINI